MPDNTQHAQNSITPPSPSLCTLPLPHSAPLPPPPPLHPSLSLTLCTLPPLTSAPLPLPHLCTLPPPHSAPSLPLTSAPLPPPDSAPSLPLPLCTLPPPHLCTPPSPSPLPPPPSPDEVLAYSVVDLDLCLPLGHGLPEQPQQTLAEALLGPRHPPQLIFDVPRILHLYQQVTHLHTHTRTRTQSLCTRGEMCMSQWVRCRVLARVCHGRPPRALRCAAGGSTRAHP